MIPKIIIQTWKSYDLFPEYKKNQDIIKKLHPEWEYKFFNDDDINIFIDQNFPQYRKSIKKCKRKIQLIDLFRLLAVYKYGGFYLDMDVLLHTELDPLIKHEIVFPAEMKRKNFNQYNKDYNIGNYAFASIPNHQLIQTIIDNIINALNSSDISSSLTYKEYVYNTTGPLIVTTSIYEYDKNLKNITILFPKNWPEKNSWHRFGDYGRHTLTGTWKHDLPEDLMKNYNHFNDNNKSKYLWHISILLIFICLVTTFILFVFKYK